MLQRPGSASSCFWFSCGPTLAPCGPLISIFVGPSFVPQPSPLARLGLLPREPPSSATPSPRPLASPRCLAPTPSASRFAVFFVLFFFAVFPTSCCVPLPSPLASSRLFARLASRSFSFPAGALRASLLHGFAFSPCLWRGRHPRQRRILPLTPRASCRLGRLFSLPAVFPLFVPPPARRQPSRASLPQPAFVVSLPLTASFPSPRRQPAAAIVFG